MATERVRLEFLVTLQLIPRKFALDLGDAAFRLDDVLKFSVPQCYCNTSRSRHLRRGATWSKSLG